MTLTLTPTIPLEDKIPGWITRVYGEAEGLKAEGVPMDILRELYPELFIYGPSFQRMISLHEAMELKILDRTLITVGSHRYTTKMQAGEYVIGKISNMSLYSISEETIPEDHKLFVENTRNYLMSFLFANPRMGRSYSVLLLSIVMDGIFEGERYMPETLVENMAQVRVLENLLFKK